MVNLPFLICSTHITCTCISTHTHTCYIYMYIYTHAQFLSPFYGQSLIHTISQQSKKVGGSVHLNAIYLDVWRKN